MKKLIASLFVASYVASNLFGGSVWSSPQTVLKVAEHPVAGTYIVSQNVSTNAIIKCYLRPVSADSGKTITAIALTAKTTTDPVSLYLEFKTDPNGTVSGAPCIVNGISGN